MDKVPKNTVTIVNPPLSIIGIKSSAADRSPLIGFEIKGPDGKQMAIVFDPDHAEMFIADLIRALKKMTEPPKLVN